MKRIVLWALSTITVLVLLFGYHTSTAGAGLTSATSASAPAISGSAPTPATTPSAAAGAGSDPPASGSATTTATTVTGETAQTRWGPVQVELSLDGGTITDVSVLQYPDGNGKDEEINRRALPILIQETIEAQSADIDMVSGATYTSDGYLQSLQSALDQAGA